MERFIYQIMFDDGETWETINFGDFTNEIELQEEIGAKFKMYVAKLDLDNLNWSKFE